MRNNPRALRWSMAAIGGALLALAPVSMVAASAMVSSVPPHIVARPHSVMVNSATALTGTGFPPNATIALSECGKTGWIVPQSPCSSTNEISVTTNAVGAFKAAFKVQLCPDGVRGRGPTSRICYIGESKPSGIDTITLLGAAKITVTYP